MATNLKERWASFTARLGQATLIVRARTLYESLSPRDRRLFLMLVSFFALALVGGGIWLGNKHLTRLEQEITRKQDQLKRIEEVRTEHETLKAQIAQLEGQMKQNPDFNLTSFLERAATEVAFTEAPTIQTKGETANEGFREIAVDVRLRKASLDKIVTYLHKIETAPERLTVKNLRIRTTFGSRSSLDVDIEVSVMAPQET